MAIIMGVIALPHFKVNQLKNEVILINFLKLKFRFQILKLTSNEMFLTRYIELDGFIAHPSR